MKTDDQYEDLMKPLHERLVGGVLHAANLDNLEKSATADQRARGSVVISACMAETLKLRADILARLQVHHHGFFERLIVDVLLRMGYGSRHRDLARSLGKSHDGGVDGVIVLDELGLDLIYVQAKRLKPNSHVPVSQVRDFVGSLDAHRANKGVFVTTSRFSERARSFVRSVSSRVVLIDGDELAQIMIRHNIGVRVRATFQFKELEPGYFNSL